MLFQLSTAVSLAASITGVAGHSWIHCSDYRGDTSHYEPESCFGHPRPVNGKVPQMTAFGVDTGFNEQPTTTCNDGPHDPVSGYPMARYRPGQQVTLAWPSKNHVAATCTNAFIPDTSLELFVARVDADGHPDDFVQVPASFSEDPHVNGQMDFKGFQNCPAFCENMDKALCTGTFNVPALEDGLYTFQWKWEFNAGTAPYITCFEAYVGMDVSPVEAPTPSPTAEGQTAPPTDPATQDNCTLGMWSACHGGAGCCAGGVTCQEQSQWYSQCRTDCPSGWACENVVVPLPTPDPTSSPTASPDVPAPSPAPCPSEMDVTTCPTGFGSEGRLVAPVRELYSATVYGACECWHFCRMFNYETSVAWIWKQSNLKCTCYTSAQRVRNVSGLWAGLLNPDELQNM